MLFKSLIVFLSLAVLCSADLRMASQPKNEWKVQQRNRNVPFRQKFALYMEPSDFNYQGLKNQRDGGGYDNFLRSNIDNEQDRRNFNTEPGRDHLPFRSYETAASDINQGTVKNKLSANKAPAAASATNPETPASHWIVETGVPNVVSLRWNNPHSSELEVNIWVFNVENGPYVIPIKKPVCAGEGYQDAAFTFTVPTTFNDIASCAAVGDCVLQIYAHSVESRMYSMGTPIVIEGAKGAWAPPGGSILARQEDRAFDLTDLRRLCLPSSDEAEADITDLKVYHPRLSSDVYNHAYQNSDFSPYAGQQPQYISQNLQASCILKMTVGNFGELGKQYMAKTANEARQYAGKLDKKARNLIRTYETITNAIIESIKEDVKATDTQKAEGSPEAGATECIEWRDNYSRTVGGRVRGTDRTGGWCASGLTCLCHQDCYLGYGPKDASGEDAYCAKLVPTPGDETSGKMTVEAGSETKRIGSSAQKTETCFRCPEVGSISTKRINTNTYIPSFEIQDPAAVEKARQYVAPAYLKHGYLTNPDTGKRTQKGDQKAITQIYMAVLSEMWEEFKKASDGSYLQEFYANRYNKLDFTADPNALDKYKFTYRGPVYKDTTATLSDANGYVDQQYRKLDANGAQDKGYYSASKAWVLQSRSGGSSTAVPATTGPIVNQRLKKTNNIFGGVATPASTATNFIFPTAEELTTSCAYTSQSVGDGQLTPEGEDMDGLNRDADCDDDASLELLMEQHEADCLKELEADPTYQCPDFVEPECHIEGEDEQLPTQMFTNNEQAGGINAASSAMPSVFSLAAALFALVLARGL